MLGGICAALVTGVVKLLHRDDLIWRVSVTTAWVAIGLLTVSLSLGPLKVLRRVPNPLSFDLRRDVGIWAALMAVVHTGVGLFVHRRGHPWLYFVWDTSEAHGFPIRYDASGAANWIGALATGIVLVLAALSNDAALRALGVRRWKAFQRLNYVLFGLAVVHACVYQLRLEPRPAQIVGLLALIVGATVVLQLAGFRRTRAELGRGGADS